MSELPQLNPIKTILVATDLSAASVPAVVAAASLAKRLGAAAHLIHAIPDFKDPRWDYVAGGMPTRLKEEHERELRAMVKEHVGNPTAFSRVAVVNGNAADVILSEAEKINAELIVVGTHGHTGLKHLMLGSIAEHIASNAPADVLLVRRAGEDTFSKPLVALNDTPAARRACARAASLADAFGWDTLVVSSAYDLPLGWHSTGHPSEEVSARIRKNQTERLQPVLDELRTKFSDVQHSAIEGHPADVLLHAAAGNQCDLVFAGSHNRPRWTNALLGDTARVLAHKLSCATWLVRDAAEKHPLRDAILGDLGLL